MRVGGCVRVWLPAGPARVGHAQYVAGRGGGRRRQRCVARGSLARPRRATSSVRIRYRVVRARVRASDECMHQTLGVPRLEAWKKNILFLATLGRVQWFSREKW